MGEDAARHALAGLPFSAPRLALVLVLALAGLWATTGSASAATGDLTLAQCIEDNDSGTEAACTPDVDGLGDATSVAVTADGTSVYAVSPGDDAIVNFNRNTTSGALTFSECFDDDSGGSEAACTGVTGMNGAQGVAVSPDGTSVYVASNSDDAIVNFDRNTGTGALTGATCFEDTGAGSTCTDTVGLNNASSVAVAPNGSSVYVVASSDDSIVNFDRANAGGATNGDLSGAVCFEDVGQDECATEVAGLDGATGVAASPDGTSVYVASNNDDSVVNFDRANAGGATNGDLSGAVCFEDNDQSTEAACADTDGLFNANSVAVAPDAKSVYVAASSGTDGDDALVNFDRNTANGDITVAECFDDPGNETACTDTDGLAGAASVAVSPEGGRGESVYVAANGDDAVVNFDRNASGLAANGDLSGAVCIEDVGQNECPTEAAGLDGATGVAGE